MVKRLKRVPRSGNGPPDLSLSEAAADQDGQTSGEPMQRREKEGEKRLDAGEDGGMGGVERSRPD